MCLHSYTQVTILHECDYIDTVMFLIIALKVATHANQLGMYAKHSRYHRSIFLALPLRFQQLTNHKSLQRLTNSNRMLKTNMDCIVAAGILLCMAS